MATPRDNWLETVQPASARRETISVAAASLLVILAAGILISVRGRVEATMELADYQISGYDGLNATEQGIYNDLLTASLDIDLYHADTLRWPSVLQLQGQYIAPFVHDLSWQQRGALDWQQVVPDIEMQHTVAYYALSQKPDVAGSFLLWMTHKHNMTGPAAEAFMASRGGKGNTITEGPGMVPGAVPRGASVDLGVPGLPGAAPLPPPGQANAALSTKPLQPIVRVWYHPGTPDSPPSLFQDEQLIQAGWKEVVPRTGTQESTRLQGRRE